MFSVILIQITPTHIAVHLHATVQIVTHQHTPSQRILNPNIQIHTSKTPVHILPHHYIPSHSSSHPQIRTHLHTAVHIPKLGRTFAPHFISLHPISYVNTPLYNYTPQFASSHQDTPSRPISHPQRGHTFTRYFTFSHNTPHHHNPVH